MTAAQALATTHKLAPEVAQAAVEFAHVQVQDYVKGVQKGWSDKVNAWHGAINADPDVGGDKFAASKEAANQTLFRFFDPAFIKELNDSGLALHPGLFRGLAKIGLAAANDRIVKPAGNSGGAQKSQADQLREDYPTMFAPKT